MTRTFSALLLVLAAACSAARTPTPATPAPRASSTAPTAAASTVPLPPGASLSAIHWWRDSAERRAIFIEIYGWAGDRLRALAANERRGTWAVIVDGDETVIDNSAYQLRRASQGLGYTPESWNAWVREEASTATPGAVEFTRVAHNLGGSVVVVSNRDEAVCDVTRDNLRKVGVAFDLVLCRPQGTSDKNARFQAVQNGTAAPGLPPLTVLMWVGDNIEDFPALHQDVRTRADSAFARFGRTYVVLPDPMYGSWERNPLQ